jgi:hypothetical protein
VGVWFAALALPPRLALIARRRARQLVERLLRRRRVHQRLEPLPGALPVALDLVLEAVDARRHQVSLLGQALDPREHHVVVPRVAERREQAPEAPLGLPYAPAIDHRLAQHRERAPDLPDGHAELVDGRRVAVRRVADLVLGLPDPVGQQAEPDVTQLVVSTHGPECGDEPRGVPQQSEGGARARLAQGWAGKLRGEALGPARRLAPGDSRGSVSLVCQPGEPR